MWRGYDSDEHGRERALVGSCDGAIAIAAVVPVVMTMLFDRGTEGILEDLSQDIFHVVWNIAGYFFQNKETGERDMGNGRRTRKWRRLRR